MSTATLERPREVERRLSQIDLSGLTTVIRAPKPGSENPAPRAGSTKPETTPIVVIDEMTWG
jgi:hypothetical protein